jgi:hypothetical protein
MDVITQLQLQKNLQKEPFHMEEQESFYLARYLTEDDTEEFVIVDKSRQNQCAIIESIFRHAVGKILRFTPEEDMKQYSAAWSVSLILLALRKVVLVEVSIKYRSRD